MATVERRRQAQPGSRIPKLVEAGSLGAGGQSPGGAAYKLPAPADGQRGHRRRRRQPDKKVDTAFQRSSVFVRNLVGGGGGWDVAAPINASPTMGYQFCPQFYSRNKSSRNRGFTSHIQVFGQGLDKGFRQLIFVFVCVSCPFK